MSRCSLLVPCFVTFWMTALLAGCAANRAVALKEVSASTRLAAEPAAPLTRSLFQKPPERENLSEEVIQQIVNAPVEPDFPARAGVVVLSRPFTRAAYASLEPGDEAPQLLAREIERSRHFVLVSDISPYLADGQHIESLRELATRYRLKYLVVMNVRYADRSMVNGWGWGWLSLIGIPFLPAYTLRAYDIAQQEWPWLDALCLWVFRFPWDQNSYQDYFTFVRTDFEPKPIYTEVQRYARASTP
jgi:hypothetical protein